MKILGFGVLAPISMRNGDFASIFSTVRICSCFLKTKALFTPGFNSVN
jgi:hypothetical protein